MKFWNYQPKQWRFVTVYIERMSLLLIITKMYFILKAFFEVSGEPYRAYLF